MKMKMALEDRAKRFITREMEGRFRREEKEDQNGKLESFLLLPAAASSHGPMGPFASTPSSSPSSPQRGEADSKSKSAWPSRSGSPHDDVRAARCPSRR
jgi:hypothetical protein